MSVTVTGELEELYKEMVTNPLHSKDFIENGLSKLKLILREPCCSPHMGTLDLLFRALKISTARKL